MPYVLLSFLILIRMDLKPLERKNQMNVIQNVSETDAEEDDPANKVLMNCEWLTVWIWISDHTSD